LLPEHLFRAVLEGGSGDLIGAIAIAQHHLKAFEMLNKGQDWSKDPKGIIRKWNKIFIPNDNEIIFKVIWAHHDSPVAGHPGQYRTQELTGREFWWPTMTKDIKKYVEACEVCQRTKIHRRKSNAPLYPTEIATEPWETIAMDIIGPLPESKGYNAILVITEYLTKMKILVPCTTEITSAGVAVILRRELFRKHGLPKKVISDRGSNFVSHFMQALYKLLGIKGAPSTAYHPQTDGMNERSHQETEQYLAAFTNYHQDDWLDWLDIAEFVQNDHEHTATKQTPFYLVYGRHPWKGIDTGNMSISPQALDLYTRMKEIHSEAITANKMAKETMKRFYDRTKGKSIDYHIREKVWLEGKNLKPLRPTKKFADKRYGPFTILEKIGKSSYKLEIPKTWKQIHPVFNEVLLSPYHEPAFKGQQRPPPPPPVEIEGHPEYEVEEILNVQKQGKKNLSYLVHWKGYTHEEDTWEPLENLEGSEIALTDFYKKNPKALKIRFLDVRSMPIGRETDNGCPFYTCYDVSTSEKTINYSDVGVWIAL